LRRDAGRLEPCGAPYGGGFWDRERGGGGAPPAPAPARRRKTLYTTFSPLPLCFFQGRGTGRLLGGVCLVHGVSVLICFAAFDALEAPPPLGSRLGWLGRRQGQGRVDQIAQRPNAVGNPKLDGWGSPQRFVNPAKVVVGHVQRHGRRVV